LAGGAGAPCGPGDRPESLATWRLLCTARSTPGPVCGQGLGLAGGAALRAGLGPGVPWTPLPAGSQQNPGQRASIGVQALQGPSGPAGPDLFGRTPPGIGRARVQTGAAVAGHPAGRAAGLAGAGLGGHGCLGARTARHERDGTAPSRRSAPLWRTMAVQPDHGGGKLGLLGAAAPHSRRLPGMARPRGSPIYWPAIRQVPQRSRSWTSNARTFPPFRG
jgi:hypothetical protein